MNPAFDTIQLKDVKKRIDAADADLSGSVFRDVDLSGTAIKDVDLSESKLDDVNLSRVVVNNADLTGACFSDCRTSGMTLNGIPMADLLAAYRAAHPKL